MMSLEQSKRVLDEANFVRGALRQRRLGIFPRIEEPVLSTMKNLKP